MTTRSEYIQQNFSKANPQILDLLLNHNKDIETDRFLGCYRSICALYKADCKRMYPGWYQKDDRDDYARFVAGALGWYDWFCKPSALIGRTERYGSMINSIIKAVPSLAENTVVGMSQRWGNGYVDFFGISPKEGSDKPYGYGIKVQTKEDVDMGRKKYYVYRDDRSMGADFETDRFSEVVNFIRWDIELWKLGNMTKSYGDDIPTLDNRAGWVEDLPKRTVKA